MKDVMVDLETLATTADAVIMSIGAVRFDAHSDKIDDNGFYASICVESNLLKGRRVSEDTLIWWMKQSAAAQAVFHEPKITLETALWNFADWVAAADPTSDTRMWSNGADFDLPMLAHAYAQHQAMPPWRHWNSRCVRTLRNLPGIQAEPLNNNHNALADAVNQAKCVQALFKNMQKATVHA